MASAVLDYLNYTTELRGSDNKNLFIAIMKLFGAVLLYNIGHWIKTLLGKVDINTSQFIICCMQLLHINEK